MMMKQETIKMLMQIFETCIIPLLGILTYYAVQLIKVKINNIKDSEEDNTKKKYVELLGETVIHCVLATQQTYVDSLKEQGKFDLEAQKNAFNMTKEAILKVLSQEAQTYLKNIYGDLNSYLETLIEAEIRKNKK